LVAVKRSTRKSDLVGRRIIRDFQLRWKRQSHRSLHACDPRYARPRGHSDHQSSSPEWLCSSSCARLCTWSCVCLALDRFAV